MMQGVDCGIVGEAYDAADPYQDRQKTLNYYVEVTQNDKSKTISALLGCPGKNPIIQLSVVGAVRGSWVLPGGNTAIVVSGNTAYLVTTTVPATQTSIAQFSTAIIGTLLTNSGPVVIRDNGAGGYAVIVDGPYGYYYRLAGAGSTTITAAPTSGSVTLPYSGTLNTALVAGSAISGTGIAVGATIVSINTSVNTITMSLAATSTPGATTITVTLAQYAQITDPAFLGSDRLAFIDGWLIFNQPNTQNFYTTAPVPYTLIFDGSFFAKIDTGSDNLVSFHDANREAWMVGERHSEIWYDGGGAQFAFQRVPGAAPQIGCAAKHSIARAGDALLWLAKNEQGENQVIQTQQYGYNVISTNAISHQISLYPLVSDAFAYTYEEERHLFYVLVFPTADKTWVYDLTTKMWHERASYDANLGVFHRDRGNCFMNLQNLRLVGDYQSGQIHRLDRSIYTDAGNILYGRRQAPHVWKAEDRERLFHASLQIEFAPGVGLDTGQGVDPQAMLKWSDDAGDTFGTEHWTSIGKKGRTKNRAIWRRLSQARDRVYQVNITDPVKRDIVGATLYYGT